MSNIIVSPTSGVIEFNTGDASGSAFHTSTAPIRLDATGGNTFFTGTNIGIGTSTPTGLLDINGVSYFRGGTTVGHIQNESDAPIIIEDNNYIHSQNAGTYLRRVIGKDSAGAIHIGEPGTSIINEIKFQAGQGALTKYTFHSGTTELVRIDASGNVGIGTNIATPQYDKTLHIEGANPTVRLETNYSAGWAYNQYVSPETTWSVGINNLDQFVIANSAVLDNSIRLLIDDSNGNIDVAGNVTANKFVTDGTTASTFGIINADSGIFASGITINGNPVSTGAAGGSVGTLQQVTDNGATTTNNIGIGTNSPVLPLHVEGSVLIDAYNQTSGSGQGIFFRQGFTASNKYNLSILTHNDGDTSPDALDINAYDGINFCVGSNARNPKVIINSAGNVGIGTTSASYPLVIKTAGDGIKLDVTDGVDANFRVNVNGAVTEVGPSTANFALMAGGAERVRIDAGGVGIGTTNPAEKLHVSGGNIQAYGTGIFGLAGNDIIKVGHTAGAGVIDCVDDNLIIKTSSSERISLSPNGSPSLTATSAGNVGIGTDTVTTPGGTAKLTVQSSSVAFSWGPSASDFVYHRRLSAGKFQIVPYYGGNVGELHLAPYGGNDTPVVIGATSAEAGVKLHVEGVISGSDNAFFDGNITISGNPVITGSGTTSTHIITESEGIGSNNNDFTIPTSAAVKAYVDVAGGGGGGGSVGTLQQVTTLGADTSVAVELNGGVTASKSTHPVTLNRTDGSSALINLQTQGGSRGFLGASSTDAFSIFNATPTRLLTVVNDGKVGIGTATPSGNLHVKDATVAGYKSDTYARLITEAGDSRIQVVSDNGGNNGSALILTNVNAGTHSNWVFGQTTTSQSNKLHIGHNATAGGDVSHYSNSNDLTLTTDGKVGIGSFSPAFVLDTVFAGDNGARIKSSDNHSVLTIQSHSSYGGYIRFTDGDNRYWIHNDPNNSLYFRPKGVAPSSNVGVVFDETGRVGIGSSDPDEKLRVVGGNICVTNGQYFIFDGAGSKNHKMRSYYDGSQGHVEIMVGGTDVLDMAADGNVGIGTSNPSQRLNVSGGNIRIDHQDPQLMFNDIGGSTYSSSWMYQNNAIKFVWGGGHKFKVDSAGGVTLGQSYSTSETAPSKGIIAEGKVGLGTTNPAATFHVGDTTNETNGTAIISGTGTSTPAANLYVYGSGNGDVINAVRARNDASIKVTSQTAGAYFRTNSATPSYNGIDLNTNWFIGQYGYNDLRIVDGTASAGDAAAAVTVQNSTKYVGIGTTNPDAPLHIKSTTNIQTLRINSAWNEGVGAVATISTSANGNVLLLESATTSDSREIFEVKNSNGTVFEVQGDGKVGIGTATPEAELHLFSGTAKFESADGSDNSLELMRQDNANTWNFNHAGNDLRIFNTAGAGYDILLGVNAGSSNIANKVGIGTAIPARRLDVSTNGSDTYGIRNSYSASYYMEMSHNSFNHVGNNRIFFNIGNNTRMAIVDSAYGNGVNGVGIGTTEPNYELEVVGTTKSTYFIGGAYFEENASSSKLKFYKDGTVLVMDEDGELKPCNKENDTLVFGVSKTDFNAPVVLGAEPILVTGPIKVGDYIVTSNKQGHGQAMKEQKLGTIIAQAMENGDGESYNIKAMIRKM